LAIRRATSGSSASPPHHGALESGKVDLDTWQCHKTLVIRFSGDRSGRLDLWLPPKYTGSLNLAGFRNDVIAGARVFAGDNKARQFINVSGTSGAQTLNAPQER